MKRQASGASHVYFQVRSREVLRPVVNAAKGLFARPVGGDEEQVASRCVATFATFRPATRIAFLDFGA